MKNETQNNLEQYIDHQVVDQTGNKIGKLQCLWLDSQGEPTFLGIQTGWLFGKTHVVPANRADVNASAQTIRLPYTLEKIKEAPSYDAGIELDPQTEQHVRSFYGVRAAAAAPNPPATQAETQKRSQQAATVQLHEEQLKVGKRSVDAGGIRLRKIVRTEVVNQPVELQREEIVVERVPGTAQSQGTQVGGKEFQQEEIYIPLRREEAVVQKENRVREEVRVSKKAQTERQTVSERVRKEDVEVERAGNGNVRGGAPMTQANAPARGTQPTGQKRGKSTGGNRAVFCLCHDGSQASRIVDDLKQAGFSKNDISVLFPDKSGTKDFAHEKSTKAPEGATTGAGTGGVLGGVLGWLAGVGALAIPGVGPFIAAGPIMAALGGAAIGAGTGGLIGALVGLGIPEYEAKRYEGKLKEGNILISVHSDNSEETRRAKEIFERAGAEDISSSGEEKVMAHSE
jgi:uncharacterized protein (TIGR02271 family)